MTSGEGDVTGDPGVLEAYAGGLDDAVEQIMWSASRLTAALDRLAASNSEFLGPLGDHGRAVGQVGEGLRLLSGEVRVIAKAFRAADTGKLGVGGLGPKPKALRAADTGKLGANGFGPKPNALALKVPTKSTYTGGGKPQTTEIPAIVSGLVPGPGNWAGLPAGLITDGKGVADRVLKAGADNVKLSTADEVALGAFWWDCQSRGVADPKATEVLYQLGHLLHAPTLLRVVNQARVNAIAAFGNAELALPAGVGSAMEFLDSHAARSMSNVVLRAELLKRCRVTNPVEASALETWLTFQVGTAAQQMMTGGVAFPSSDVMTPERWWGWTVPFPVEPWVARLGGLVTGNFSSPLPLVMHLKPVSVLMGWLSGKPITDADRHVGGVVGVTALTGVQKFLVGLVVVGVVSAAVYSGVAEASSFLFASAVTAGTLTALEASVLTMIVAGATAGVAGGVTSRILAVVEGDLDPKEIWTLRGVLTDAAIGAVLTIGSHAVTTKIKELVALGKQEGLAGLKARLAEFLRERQAWARNERGSVSVPSGGQQSPGFPGSESPVLPPTGSLGIGDVYSAHQSVNLMSGVSAELVEGGVLELYVVKGASTPPGFQMFDEAVDAFGSKVLQIKGDWSDIVGMDTNFKQFQDGVAKGMTPAQAALSTWTGKNAARRGFGAVKSVVQGPGWVQVLFGKG